MSDTWQYLNSFEEGPISDEWVWERLRHRRNAELRASDFRVLPDVPWDVEPWLSYREALRQLPSVTVNPRQAVWPVAPAGPDAP